MIVDCTWPSLPEPFAAALREAVDFIFEELDPVGIIATGTIIRGTANPSSDLDLYVIHLASYRRRIQRFFHGVPAEIFVNPPGAVRVYFRDEDRDGRRITAHMLATGAVVFRADPIVDELRDEATRWLAKETHMSDFDRITARYGVATRLEDALDVVNSDDVTGVMLLSDAVLGMLEYFCKAERGRIPRRKELLAELATIEPTIADLATKFFRANTAAERSDLALQIADRSIATRGFFSWDSGPGPAPTYPEPRAGADRKTI